MRAATRRVPKNLRCDKISAAFSAFSARSHARRTSASDCVECGRSPAHLLFGGGNRDPLGRVHGINDFTKEHDELFAAFGANRLS